MVKQNNILLLKLIVYGIFYCISSYIYQPIDELILVVITTKGSNIMEDLGTLRLLSKRIFKIDLNSYS